jgi:hypothetical protein
MPRTLIGVGSSLEPAASSGVEPEAGPHLDVAAGEGGQQLVHDDTDQHETHLMLRDAVRTELGRANASKSAAGPGSVKLLPSPDFQDPTPIASSGARKELGKRRRPTVVALLIGLVVLLGGVVIWTRAHSTGSASDGAPPPSKELVPVPTEARPAPPPLPPVVSAAAPPPDVASATPPPDVASATPPTAPEKPAVSRPRAGSPASKPAPVKPSSPAPTAKPTPGGGEDLANPYR